MIFPDDEREANPQNFKLLQMAHAWKQAQAASAGGGLLDMEDSDDSDDDDGSDADEADSAAPAEGAAPRSPSVDADDKMDDE